MIAVKEQKNHHSYPKTYIGGSDIATLIMVGPPAKDGDALSKELCFGEDGDYTAYIVDDKAIIPEYYHHVASFNHWLKIYDDDELCFSQNGNFSVYRAGDFGCIIQKL